jgi:hypothetical protein
MTPEKVVEVLMEPTVRVAAVLAEPLFTVPPPVREPTATFCPFSARNAPLAIDTAEPVPRADELPATTVPWLMTVGPEYVFVPLRVSWPPFMVMLPDPDIAPAKVSKPPL